MVVRDWMKPQKATLAVNRLFGVSVVGGGLKGPVQLFRAVRYRLPLKLMQHLEGTWTGEGVGEYPPHVPRFQYIQELVIEKAIPHSTKQLNWSFKSTSYHRDTKQPIHSECGFLRFHPIAHDHGRLELTCQAPNGLCEIQKSSNTTLCLNGVNL
jgi:hypothetical protein